MRRDPRARGERAGASRGSKRRPLHLRPRRREIEALNREGIPFEVVPGVTSALGGPACAGIPLRTGRRALRPHDAAHTEGTIALSTTTPSRNSAARSSSSWAQRRRGDLRRTQTRWMAEETRAAALENAGTGAQRLITGTLRRSPPDARRKIESPALIIAGEVTALAGIRLEKFLPLAGRKVIVTPARTGGRLSAMLRARALSSNVLHLHAPHRGGAAGLFKYGWLDSRA
ncbi:MAG: SAM-dependent methyltransferase [Cloacibacillus evryensis]